jgi:hypothetical protein
MDAEIEFPGTFWTSGRSSITVRGQRTGAGAREPEARTEVVVQEAILPVESAASIPLCDGFEYLAEGRRGADEGRQANAQWTRHVCSPLVQCVSMCHKSVTRDSRSIKGKRQEERVFHSNPPLANMSVTERTYIMIKVYIPSSSHLCLSIQLLSRSLTAFSALSSERSSPGSRNAVTNSSPSSLSTLPPSTSRSVASILVVHPPGINP